MSAVPPFGASVSYLAWHYVKDDEQLSIRVSELQTVFVQGGVGMELARHMGTVTAKLERAQGPIGPLDAAQADTIDGPLGRQSTSGITNATHHHYTKVDYDPHQKFITHAWSET